MKRFMTALLAACMVFAMHAQSFYLCDDGRTSTSTQLTFSQDGTTVNGMATASVDSITMHVPELRFVGGDISLLPTYEAHGAGYKDHDGKSISDVIDFLKTEGWNAMRVRLFVDPSKATAAEKGQGVRQDLDYVVSLGRRIKAAGLLLMLDFHYSDTWADPSKQWTPDSWLGLDDAALAQKIYAYTRECLEAMNAAGASPDFIQTGNEISYGMLWGKRDTQDNRCYMGSDAGWERFATLLKQAGRACREVCPQAKIVLHTERVKQASVLSNFYNQMEQRGVDYDIIGLSYYPYYHGTLSTLNMALSQMETNFPEKHIMIVETGHSYKYKVGDDDTGYALTDAGQKQFTDELIQTLRRHPRVNGLFWWFPEANEYGLDWSTKRVTDNWYNASLFDNATGRATSALSALRNFIAD